MDKKFFWGFLSPLKWKLKNKKDILLWDTFSYLYSWNFIKVTWMKFRLCLETNFRVYSDLLLVSAENYWQKNMITTANDSNG